MRFHSLPFIARTIMSNARKPKVLVTHPKLPSEALSILQEKCDVTICNGLPEPTREEILTKSQGMDAILWATHARLDAEALDRIGPQIRAISTKSAGIDYVDVPEVKRRGIPLGYTPSVLNDSVAELAIGLLLSAARRFHEGYFKIVENNWEQGDPQWMLGQDIKHSTVGIVGLGGIGLAILKKLRSFEVGKFLYTGHKEKPEGREHGAEFVSLDDLLRQSDFVVVTCPLTEETRNMFNKSAFEKMKRSSVFVNVARGGIVVQDDLVAALQNNTIFAAGLDVVVPEPLPHDHVLTKLRNCVVVPHLGTATGRTEGDMAILAARNILNVLEGLEMKSPVFTALPTK